MSQVVSKIGHEVEIVAEDVAKGVAYPVEFAAKAARVLSTAIAEQPELKSVLTQLVQQAEKIATSVLADAGDKGLNLAGDLTTIEQVELFFAYFRSTVEPLVVKLYGDVVADVS